MEHGTMSGKRIHSTDVSTLNTEYVRLRRFRFGRSDRRSLLVYNPDVEGVHVDLVRLE